MKEKLVRDEIPRIIAEEKQEAVIRTEFDSERIQQLTAAKVLEEAQEVSEALLSGSNNELAEEIADLLEVIDKVIAISGVDYSSIYPMKLAKRTLKGGFNNNYVMRLK